MHTFEEYTSWALTKALPIIKTSIKIWSISITPKSSLMLLLSQLPLPVPTTTTIFFLNHRLDLLVLELHINDSMNINYFIIGVGKSRLIFERMQNTAFIILLFILVFYILYMNNCKLTFAHPCVWFLSLLMVLRFMYIITYIKTCSFMFKSNMLWLLYLFFYW